MRSGGIIFEIGHLAPGNNFVPGEFRQPRIFLSEIHLPLTAKKATGNNVNPSGHISTEIRISLTECPRGEN